MSFKTAAFFDVDGTLFKANAIEHYLNLTTPYISQLLSWLLISNIIIKIPYYFILDRISRQKFNQAFYRNYRHLSVIQLQRRSQVYSKSKLINSIFLAAKDCIAKHKEQGDLVILVTGSLDFIVEPLAKFLNVDAVIATKLQIKDGFYTGEIIGITPIGEEKAKRIRNLSINLEIDLNNSYAYGDSTSDLLMLDTVGNPIVINPDRTLKRIANQKIWSIKYWN